MLHAKIPSMALTLVAEVSPHDRGSVEPIEKAGRDKRSSARLGMQFCHGSVGRLREVIAPARAKNWPATIGASRLRSLGSEARLDKTLSSLHFRFFKEATTDV